MPQGLQKSSDVREALIALGGNVASTLGPPIETIGAAVAAIEARAGRVTGKSGLWRTPAFPPGSGPDFVNAALRLETALAPGALLKVLQGIEAELGRVRAGRWGARVIDLDLLAMGHLVLPDAGTQARWMDLPPEAQQSRAPAGLILPHPRLQDRAFVLVPLAEVAPLWRHPRTGLTVAVMLEALPPAERAEIRPL